MMGHCTSKVSNGAGKSPKQFILRCLLWLLQEHPLLQSSRSAPGETMELR